MEINTVVAKMDSRQGVPRCEDCAREGIFMQWHLENECPKRKDRMEEMATEDVVTKIEVIADVHATQDDGRAVCASCNSEDHGHF